MKRIFFTLNGSIICTIKNACVGEDLYFTVCLFSQCDKVSVNFGQKEFMFDYAAHYEELKNELVKDITKFKITNDQLFSIISGYLKFSGFSKTLNALENISNTKNKKSVLASEKV